MLRKKSNKHTKVLDFIKRYTAQKGYPPTVREICKGVGLKSTSTVHMHLATLEELGYIRRDPTRPRAIEVLSQESHEYDPTTPVNFPDNTSTRSGETNNVPQLSSYNAENTYNVPVIGEVTAGEPILADENIKDYFPLPFHYVRGKNIFMLEVKGDSMINAGIFDGDLVIVNKQPTAHNGEIIVALMDNEATVKRFFKENDHVRLQPENEAYSSILTKDLIIIGKVIGLFRAIF